MILLQQLIPDPIENQISEASQIWNCQVAFNTKEKYIVHAESGKGKSTLIHILYGLRSDYSGTISVDDRDLRSLNKENWSQVRQSYFSIIFQDLRLFGNFTGLENLKVKADLYEHEEFLQNALEMVDFLNVNHTLNKKCSLLSYGERQRLAIIRALNQPFQMLLMDEPFSHLDEKNIEKASELIEKTCINNNAGWMMSSLGSTSSISFDHLLTL